MSIILIPVDADNSTSAVSNNTVSNGLIAIQLFPNTLETSPSLTSADGNNEAMNMFLLTSTPSNTENDSKSHLDPMTQSIISSKVEESLVTPKNIQKPFECKYCDKKFVLQKTLSLHRKTHVSENSASGNENECSENSDDDNYLLDEEDTYIDVSANLDPCISSNEKPFECEKCGERFLLKPALKLHNDIHLYESSSVNINDINSGTDEEGITSDAYADISSLISSTIQTLGKSYECDKCGEKFLLKTSLKKHYDIHTRINHQSSASTDDVGNFLDPKCSDINYDYSKIDEKVMEDISTNASANLSPSLPSNILLEKPFVCKTCGERFFLGASLKKHNKIHVLENHEASVSSNCTENSMYELSSEINVNDNNDVSEKTVEDTNLDEHDQSPPNINLNEPFECEDDERVVSENSSKEHDKIISLENYHSSVLINDADNSVYLFCSENSDKSMEVTVSDPCSSSSKCIPCNMKKLEKPYECEKCNERFLLKTSLKKHYKIHSYESHYSPISTNDIDNSIDVEETYGCDKCGKVFVGKNSLDAHMKKHTEKNNECSICQRKFKSVAVLENHMHLHTKGMIHVCRICKKSFFSQSILKAHLTIHSVVKPYVCEICKKSFSEKTLLTEHVRIHTEEKPYKCPICNLMCFSLSSLKEHVMSH